MTTPGDGLAAFIAARLDEDEAAALAASPSPWHLNAEGDEVIAVDDLTVAEAFALSGNQQRATAAHIARHDPARVLREVEAKRAMLIALGAAAGSPPWDSAFRITLRCTGIAWSDHPDYRAEWAPHARRD